MAFKEKKNAFVDGCGYLELNETWPFNWTCFNNGICQSFSVYFGRDSKLAFGYCRNHDMELSRYSFIRELLMLELSINTMLVCNKIIIYF